MQKISLDVVDDRIVNEVEFVQTLINLQNDELEIYINEGPDLEQMRFMNKPFLTTLLRILNTLKIPKEKIYFVLYNWIQDESIWPNIKKLSGLPWFVGTESYFPKTYHKDIKKHFGFFINNSRWHRLYMGTFLHAEHNQKTLMSYRQSHFHAGSPADLYFDELMFKLRQKKDAKFYDQCGDFFKALPINLEGQFPNDNRGGAGFYVTEERELGNHSMDILPFYSKFFVDIVAETWHTGRCFMPTEKTVRPIITKNPFIVYGPKGYLKNLRKLGFKTFNRWWSEEYDEWPETQRLHHMFDLINKLAEMSIKDLEDMYQQMLPVLEHNQKILKELTHRRIRSVFNLP